MTLAEPDIPRKRDNADSGLNASSAEAEGPGTATSSHRAAEDRLLPPSSSKQAVLDWALDEYYRLVDEGERPDLEAYCDRFPICRSDLLLLLQFNAVLGRHPELMAADPGQLAWPVAGEKRGDLTIVRLLGRGRFSRVYLASEESTGGRLVAVKFSWNGAAEARTLGRLSHPHIVPILSARAEESSDLMMVCMPYLGSATLENVLDRVRTAVAPSAVESAKLRLQNAVVFPEVLRACAQPEDPPAVVDSHLRAGRYADGVIHLAIQMAEALAFMHERHVCHRDLKPSNVLLDPSGRALLLDFNLSTSKQEGAVPRGGTLPYMAPEQLRAFLHQSIEEIDERADLFALGVIVYELLAGRHSSGPIPAGISERVLASLLLERMKDRFQPLRRCCPDLAKPVAAALDRCLSLDPAGRPRSAAEVAAELRRQFRPARRLRRWLVDRPRSVAAALLLLAVTAVAGAHAWLTAPPYSVQEYQQGEAAYRAGDYDGAERHFDLAVQADPSSNRRSHLARGCARLKQSEYQLANHDKLDQAWADLLPPGEGVLDAPALAVNAYIQSRKQNAQEAIARYNQIPAGYQPVMVLNNRAYCYLLRKNYQEARNDLNKAAQLDPQCQAVFYNRAMLAYYERSGSPESLISSQALSDMEHAIRLGPVTPHLYRDAALLYDRASSDDLRRIPAALDAPIVSALHLQARQQRVATTLAYLRLAIASGEPPDSLLRSRRFHTAEIASMLGELSQVRPQRVLSFVELRLINPVDLPD
jgi:serine/threonine protein kinase/Flp pilus assembly protein TadD